MKSLPQIVASNSPVAKVQKAKTPISKVRDKYHILLSQLKESSLGMCLKEQNCRFATASASWIRAGIFVIIHKQTGRKCKMSEEFVCNTLASEFAFQMALGNQITKSLGDLSTPSDPLGFIDIEVEGRAIYMHSRGDWSKIKTVEMPPQVPTDREDLFDDLLE